MSVFEPADPTLLDAAPPDAAPPDAAPPDAAPPDAGAAPHRPTAGADLLDHGAVHRAFEAVADRHAEREAVRAPDGRLTYGELDRRANRIAHRLIRRRGGREDDPRRPVLLLLEPGVDFVAAALGVLKAGRFFVALDPVSPAERNRVIAADSGARLALTHGRLGSRLAGLGRFEVIDLAAPSSHRPSDLRPDRPVALADLAALTYTSGSTGRPKGVMQTHATLLHNVAITRDALGVGPADRMTLLYPPSVNPALRDTFTALLGGAVLAPFLVTLDGLPALAEWLVREAVTVLCCGVTLFRQLAGHLSPPGFAGPESPESPECPQPPLPSLRGVKLGGEPVTGADVATFRRLVAPPCPLYFGLGTTETGTVTCCFVDGASPPPTATVPLGRPAPDTEILLVAADGTPVAPGVNGEGEEGEIVVRSAFLSPGYWRRPELTARVFAKATDGRGLYRTGDLGRRAADGTYEHRGRADAQVKVRGVRVELGEVEVALAALPGVRAAAARGVPSAAGEVELRAYLEADGGAALHRGELRRHLARSLPPAMVPRSFVVVPRLPVTANGKLDRAALPDLPGRVLPEERRFSYPRDPIETRLAALWCEVLGREVVGIDESFFDLGGDSLAAVRLFAAIERRFGRVLPLAGIFEAPTIADQAALLRDELVPPTPAPVVTLVGDGAGPPLFCVPAVDGYPFVYLPLSRRLAGERPLHVLQFPGLDGTGVFDTGAPLDGVESLAAELVRRMRAVQPHGPYQLLGHSFGGMVAWEMTRQLQAAGERVSLLALCDSHTRRAVGLLARGVRDAELLALRAGGLWREAGAAAPGRSRRLLTVAATLAHTVRRAVARRRRNTVVEHAIHEVRRVATAARQRYRLRGRLALPGGRVVLFRAGPGRGAARLWCRLVERSNGWARHFVDPVEVLAVPGDHITMLQGDNVDVLAAALREAAAAAPGTNRGAIP